MNSQQKLAIRKAISEGIYRNAERIFNLSQNTAACYVPVDTGNLKRSGVIERITGGARIAYRAPYSADVEFGIDQARPIEGVQVVHKRAVKRKGYRTANGTYVPSKTIAAHDVTYENKRLVRIRPKISKFEYGPPIYRVISEIKARPGQFFLTRAVKDGLEHLSGDIEFMLKRLET